MIKRPVKTLLSQGAAGGVLGSFVSGLFAVLLYSANAGLYGVLIVIFLPIHLVMGAVIGAATGFVIWISEKLSKRNLKVLSRIGIAILVTTFLSLLFTVLLNVALEARVEDDGPSLSRFVWPMIFATPIGMLAGSTIRPWRFVARGIVARPRLKVLFKKDPIRIGQTVQELKFSFLPGLPLRVASLLGLMMYLWATAWLSSFLFANSSADDWERVSHLTDDFIECLFITLYFAVTVVVSCTPVNKWCVLGIALLLHAPLAAWIINNFGFEPLNNPRTFFTSVFMGLWLLFIIGKLLPNRRGPLQVEHGHLEIRFGKQQWVRESQ